MINYTIKDRNLGRSQINFKDYDETLFDLIVLKARRANKNYNTLFLHDDNILIIDTADISFYENLIKEYQQNKCA